MKNILYINQRTVCLCKLGCLRSDTFCLLMRVMRRRGRLMIFILAILRVFSLPVSGLFILTCGLWSLSSDVSISFRELMDLHQINANYKFRACHLCFDCPNSWPSLHHNFCLLQYISWVPCYVTGWVLVMEAITTLSRWKSCLLHVVHCTHCQPFQRLSRFNVAHLPCPLQGESSHGGAPPLQRHLHQPSQVLERESVHGGPSSCTKLPFSPSTGAPSTLATSWVGSPRWIHKWFRSKVISLSFGSPPVAAMDRSKVISPSLLFPDGLLQWKCLDWRIWSTTWDRFFRLRQPGPLWSFLVRKESFRASMTRSGKKSMLSRYSFLGSQRDVSTSRMKKRKQVEDAPPCT